MSYAGLRVTHSSLRHLLPTYQILRRRELNNRVGVGSGWSARGIRPLLHSGSGMIEVLSRGVNPSRQKNGEKQLRPPQGVNFDRMCPVTRFCKTVWFAGHTVVSLSLTTVLVTVKHKLNS